MSKRLILVALTAAILLGCEAPRQELVQRQELAQGQAPAEREEPGRWQVLGRQGQGVIFIAIDPATAGDQDAYRRAAAAECPREWCQAMFWAEGTAVARSLPLSDAQVRDQLAVYNRNQATGLSRYLWRCDAFPEAGPNECFTPE